jgi:ribosomal protein L32
MHSSCVNRTRDMAIIQEVGKLTKNDLEAPPKTKKDENTGHKERNNRTNSCCRAIQPYQREHEQEDGCRKVVRSEEGGKSPDSRELHHTRIAGQCAYYGMPPVFGG